MGGAEELINTANAPILGIDINGLVSEWNKKSAELLGWSKMETLGKPLVEVGVVRTLASVCCFASYRLSA